MENSKNIKKIILRFFDLDVDNENNLKLDSLDRELLFQNLNIELDDKYNIIRISKKKIETKENFFIYYLKLPLQIIYIHFTQY